MSMSADESFILPRVHSSDEESNTDTESEFTESDAKIAYQEWISSQSKTYVQMLALILMDTFAYQEWISSQSKTYVQMLALILMDTFRDRFGMTDVGAASEAGMVVGFNEKTIRSWRNDFYANHGEFSESNQGKHSRPYVLDDDECRAKALCWLREHALSKGQPVMTSARFAHWVNNNLLPNVHLLPGFPRNITPRTASKWLHHLGFHPTPYRKGVYVDGHERSDVVEYRQMYLRKIEILESTHLPPPPCADGNAEENIGNPGAQRKLVLLYHDESSFHANEGPWTIMAVG